MRSRKTLNAKDKDKKKIESLGWLHKKWTIFSNKYHSQNQLGNKV